MHTTGRCPFPLACHKRPPRRASIPPRQISHICHRQMSTPPRHLWRGGGRQAGGEVKFPIACHKRPPRRASFPLSIYGEGVADRSGVRSIYGEGGADRPGVMSIYGEGGGRQAGGEVTSPGGTQTRKKNDLYGGMNHNVVLLPTLCWLSN